MLEQHSAFVVQFSDSMRHIGWPQTPLLQPREQQSSALVQAAPSPRQKSRHLTFPVPVSGSQRPLQQSEGAVQSVPEALQLPAEQTLSIHNLVQHSSGAPQGCPVCVHIPPVVVVLVEVEEPAPTPVLEPAPAPLPAPEPEPAPKPPDADSPDEQELASRLAPPRITAQNKAFATRDIR
jgi:hypothetical protein